MSQLGSLVKYHVKNLITSLSITEFNEDNIKKVLVSLLAHSSLRPYPEESIRSEVRATMQSLISNTPKVPSLNQTVVAREQRTASKRSRPVEVGTTTPAADAKIADVNESTPQPSGVKRKRPVEAQPPLQLPSPTESFIAPRPTTRFSDLAGLEAVHKQIVELVCYPLEYPEIYSKLGIYPPTGILLHGPSGCGKTTLAAAIAGETGLTYFKVFHRYFMLSSFLICCRCRARS